MLSGVTEGVNLSRRRSLIIASWTMAIGIKHVKLSYGIYQILLVTLKLCRQSGVTCVSFLGDGQGAST